MIKYILSIAILAIVSIQSQAQGSYQTSVYFATGQHQLDLDAEKTLQELITKINELPDFDLDLRAYTDDVGSATTNKALAKDRAQAVHDFFNNKNINPTRSEVVGVGEIALKNTENADDQRQKNRRVDILITAFQPKNLQEAFSHLSNRREENIVINNQQRHTFIAKKGTIITVPKDAFQLPNGKAYHGQVHMKVKEAYSFDDFLANNLSTISNGELIESGGMVYMEATTPNGTKLDLREGENVAVSMPNNKRLKNDMQLFVSNRAGNDMTSTTNWQATGQAIRNNSYTNAPPYIPFQELEPVKAIETGDLVLPTRRFLPTKPEHPNLYQANYPFPVFDTIKARNKPNAIETPEHYSTRIQELYEYRMATYEKLRVRDSIRMDRYQQQLAVYKKDYAQYLKDQKAFVEFNAAINQFTQNIEAYDKNLKSFCDGFETAEQVALFRKIGNNERAVYQIDDYIDYLTRECELYDMPELVASLQDINLDQQIAVLDKMNKESKKYQVKNRLLYSQKTREIIQLRGLIANMLSKGQNKHFKELQEIKDPTERLYKGYEEFQKLLKEQETFNTLNKRYNKFITKHDIDSTVAAIKEVHQQLTVMHSTLLAMKMEKGLMSQQELSQYYTNSIQISNMGWINCDRFLRIDQEKMQVAIQHKYNPNTKFFVIFKDIKSVLSFDPKEGSDLYSCKMYSGVPAGADVKVVGISVTAGKTKTFEYDCKARDLNNLPVKFRDGKLSDLRAILKNV